MLKVATLASGSSGNCTVVSDGRVHILIDAGISTRRISQGLKALDIGLPLPGRQTAAPLYTAEETACELCGRWDGLVERFRVFEPGQRFAAGGLEVGTFPTSHDCARPVGHWVTDGTQKLVLCTDTGVVTPQAREAVRGTHTLIGEFNYDPEMLRKGPYPLHLQVRIRGEQGHLSNEMGGQLAAWAGSQGARRVILAHLSQENNRPALALEAAKKALGELGLRENDVELIAAPRNETTGWMEV